MLMIERCACYDAGGRRFCTSCNRPIGPSGLFSLCHLGAYFLASLAVPLFVGLALMGCGVVCVSVVQGLFFPPVGLIGCCVGGFMAYGSMMTANALLPWLRLNSLTGVHLCGSEPRVCAPGLQGTRVLAVSVLAAATVGAAYVGVWLRESTALAVGGEVVLGTLAMVLALALSAFYLWTLADMLRP